MRDAIALLILAIAVVAIAVLVCVEHRPQGYAMGWLRAGSYPGGSASLRSNLTFDAQSGVLTDATASPEGDQRKNRVGAVPTTATMPDLPRPSSDQTDPPLLSEREGCRND